MNDLANLPIFQNYLGMLVIYCLFLFHLAIYYNLYSVSIYYLFIAIYNLTNFTLLQLGRTSTLTMLSFT